MLRELKNNLNTDKISKIPFYVDFSKDEVTSRIGDNELSIFFAARLEKKRERTFFLNLFLQLLIR